MIRKRIEVFPLDSRRLDLETKFQKLENFHGEIHQAKAYLFQSEVGISRQLVERYFVDHVLECSSLSDEESREFLREDGVIVEVGFLPGVTDNTARSAVEALKMERWHGEVSSRHLYLFFGIKEKSIIERFATKYLANPLIQSCVVSTTEEFVKRDRFQDIDFPNVKLAGSGKVEVFDLSGDLIEIKEKTDQRVLALSLDEIKVIKDYFSKNEVLEERRAFGLPDMPTDVEIEILAQTWSEHCKHKIFAANINYQEKVSEGIKLGDKEISSLFKTYIRGTTYKVIKENNLDWTISLFSDNAGIVRFDDQVDLCIKVETHNSPSALDPYGGALTGILGVNRDILGCGMGAKPVGNMDVFCFADPAMPERGKEDQMPAGLLPPEQLLVGVHKGVEDGGNKSGVPTINGAIFFDDDFAGKPLVFVGTVGVLPQTLKDGRKTHEKVISPGDLIVVVGGAVGADGIHGATFSSMELNENSPATAVQIGDPLTQKRVMDFVMEARDELAFRAVTDNGAGGISSSIGEMATLVGGAKFDLAKCPLKYPGLEPWEIMISESQERMSFAVPPEDLDRFRKLAEKHGTEIAVLGEFTDSGLFEVFYESKRVATLDLEWMHEGLPAMNLQASWEGPRKRPNWYGRGNKDQADIGHLREDLLELLARPNISSKRELVKQYDHEVGGATIVKPYQGAGQTRPSDAGVLWMGALGGDDASAVLVSNGFAPRMSFEDPFLMAQYSVDEAVRNLIVSGADPKKICLLDNFCWPDPIQSSKTPDGERKLAELVRTCQGLSDLVEVYGMPLVSGKDSMKNDFRGKKVNGDPITISIPPTLLVTAMGHGRLDHLLASGPMDYEGVDLYLMDSNQKGSLSFSEFAEMRSVEKSKHEIPDWKKIFENYQSFYHLNSEGLILAAHDVSEGGLLVSICETLFGSKGGLTLEVDMDLVDFFHEGPGRFIFMAHERNRDEILNSSPAMKIGTYCSEFEGLKTKHAVWNWDELYQAHLGRLS